MQKFPQLGFSLLCSPLLSPLRRIFTKAPRSHEVEGGEGRRKGRRKKFSIAFLPTKVSFAGEEELCKHRWFGDSRQKFA